MVGCGRAPVPLGQELHVGRILQPATGRAYGWANRSTAY